MTLSPPRIGAVILAAGFGTRLAPLTDNTPKPLLDVGGKPVMTHLVNRLGELDQLASIVVVVNNRHLPQWQDWHGSLTALPPSDVAIIPNGVRTDEERIGAVADLAAGVAALAAADVDWIVVLAGDNLIDEQLAPHVEAASQAACPVVLCRDLGDHVPPGRFGEITVDEHGVITRFREKPADPASPLAATCSYVLPSSIGQHLTDYLSDGNADAPGLFVAWLAERERVIARPLTGTYFDIGNHETLALARAAHSR